MIKKTIYIFCTTFFLVFNIGAKTTDIKTQDQFIKYMKKEHNYESEKLTKLLQKQKPNKEVLRLIASPYEAKPWHVYRLNFITDKRVNDGVKFWEKNKEILNAATKKYKIPQEIMVAILGVETSYGTNMGSFEVLNTLYTLGLHYPPRSTFFLSELEEFLLLSRRENWKLDEIKGSYAGAMGMSQFISSSYTYYAVDFDNDKKVDLFNNNHDAIGSIANYFAKHRWHENKLIAKKINISEKQAQKFLQKDIKPKIKAKKLLDAGVELPKGIQPADKVTLLEFDLKNNKKEYWLGLNNFYVISRYNRSELYSLAVFQLSQKIKEKFNQKK